MKKIILIFGISIFSVNLKAQGIIGLGYTRGDGKSCSNLSACAGSGFRIRGINRSVADEKAGIKADLLKLSSTCTDVEFQEFKKGDVVAIHLVAVENGSCKWNKFILGKGKDEDEATKDAEEKIKLSPEKTKNDLGRLQLMSF